MLDDRTSPDAAPRPETAPRKGAVIKMFGVALIFVGMLDTLLSWRGGFQMDGTYALVIAFGFFLFAIGAIRSGAPVKWH